MKQTLQSILTASDAVLFPAISRNHSLNSVFCITESDVFRCNEEIAVFCRILIFKIVCASRILWTFCLSLKETAPADFIKQIWQHHQNPSFYPNIPFVLSHIRLFILFLLIPTARSCIFFSSWIL